MDLSLPLSGMQSAGNAFDSAAASITNAFSGQLTQLGNAPNQGDSIDLSSAVAGLLSSKLNFMANVQVAVAEDTTVKNTISVLG